MSTFTKLAPKRVLVICGLVLLAGAEVERQWIKTAALHLSPGAFQRWDAAVRQSTDEMDSLRAQLMLKKQDVQRLKDSLRGSAQSQRELFESGLTLQAEKRLLEKQWEIMTTYLRLDSVSRRLVVMRGEQGLESFAVGFSSPAVFGVETRPVRRLQRVVSKERFAHPERGRAQDVGGKLEWTPPQVGTSIRSNALGEFVLFTDSGLVLHGPPVKEEEHSAFPHACLGLSHDAARALYRRSFIGTKILLDIDEQAAAARGSAPREVPSTSTAFGKP